MRIPGESPDQPLPTKSRLLLVFGSIAVIVAVLYFLVDAIIG